MSLTPSLFFLANELERTNSLSRLGPAARSTIELEGTAWAFRYVLLCEWAESATKFTMNVNIKTSCFRSARLLLSQVVDRVGRIEVPLPLAAAFMYMYQLLSYKVGQCRVFCESTPWQVLLLRLPVIPGAATGTQVLQFDKQSAAYHTSFNHQRSTKSPSQT